VFLQQSLHSRPHTQERCGTREPGHRCKHSHARRHGCARWPVVVALGPCTPLLHTNCARGGNSGETCLWPACESQPKRSSESNVVVSSPSSHPAGHRCPAHPSDNPCCTLPVTVLFQLGQCEGEGEQGPRRPTATAGAHWPVSPSPSPSQVKYGIRTSMKMVTGEGGGKWEGGKVRHAKWGVALQSREAKRPAAGRPAKSPAFPWAAFLRNSLGSGRVRGVRASDRPSLACCRRLQPSICEYRTIPQHWLTEPAI
jgi:hypothetical protein